MKDLRVKLIFVILQSATAEFKLPLIVVRPECAGILRDVPMDEPKLSPATHSISPFFMENDDAEKYVKKGEDKKTGRIRYQLFMLKQRTRRMLNKPFYRFGLQTFWCQKRFFFLACLVCHYWQYLVFYNFLRFYEYKNKIHNWCPTQKHINPLCVIKYGALIQPSLSVSSRFPKNTRENLYDDAWCMIRENTYSEIFFTGFAGHVPYGFQRFGESSQKLTNSALCDFSSNYRRRQSTEWAPVNVVK